MTDLLLSEELFLLTHDDESGKADAALAPDAGLAGALLLDLAAAELLTADGKTIHAVPGSPSHPLLASAHAVIAESSKPRSAGHWVGRLPGALKPMGTQVGRSLVERGILAEHRAKFMGLFPTTKWPEVDPEPERALRARLVAVLVNGASADRRTALLISLLKPMGLVRGIVGKENRKLAEARAKEIADASAAGAAVSSAVSNSIAATQAAIMTAVIVPVITSTTI